MHNKYYKFYKLIYLRLRGVYHVNYIYSTLYLKLFKNYTTAFSYKFLKRPMSTVFNYKENFFKKFIYLRNNFKLKITSSGKNHKHLRATIKKINLKEHPSSVLGYKKKTLSKNFIIKIKNSSYYTLKKLTINKNYFNKFVYTNFPIPIIFAS